MITRRFSPITGVPFSVSPPSPQAAGLFAWWPARAFRAGAFREQRRGMVMAATGTTGYGACQLGPGMRMETGSFAADLPAIPSGPLTIGAWVQIHAFTATTFGSPGANLGAVLFTTRYNVSDKSPTLAISPHRSVGMRAYFAQDSDSTAVGAESATVFDVGKVYHVVGRFVPDAGISTFGGTWSVFVNGVLDGENSFSIGSVTLPWDGATWQIGNGATWGGSDGSDMTLMDLRIYTVAKSDAEIAAMYAPGTRWDLYRSPRVGVSKFPSILKIGRGVSSSYIATNKTGRGSQAATTLQINRTGRGVTKSFVQVNKIGRGGYRMTVQIRRAERGMHRAARAADDRYELFVGIDGDVDFTSAVATQTVSYSGGSAVISPAMEYTVTPPGSGSSTYLFVLRRRSQWGISSQNVRAWKLVVDSSGVSQSDMPSPPTDVTLEAAAGATARLRARYVPADDGDAAADTFLAYVRSDGTDPDPSIDTPTTADVVNHVGYAILDLDLGPYTEGSTVKALVRMRRTGSPSVDSVSSEIVSTTVTAVGPAAVRGDLFLGDVSTQKQ